jgi:transposase
MIDGYASVRASGVDVHSKFSTVTMRDERAKVVRRERLDHRERATMREQLSRWPKNLRVVMEASFGWQWVADEMVRAGLRPELCNCYKMEQMRKARGLCKTNKKDADLASLMPYEEEEWWKVWMAPPEVRDDRERMRHRSALVGIQTQTKNRISAWFHRHGIFHGFSDLFGAAGRKYQAQVCQAGHAGEVSLRPGALAALRGQVQLLEHVRAQLAGIAMELRGSLVRGLLAKRLDGIPGIGLILSHTLIAEIGVITRFPHHRALARYSLLAPISRDTGEDDGKAPIGRHLGRRGNRTLKWAFIEAAHGAVRKGGKWRAIFDAATEGGKKDLNRGYIKVARELVKVVYVVWSKNVDYSDQPPRRPGSSVASGTSSAPAPQRARPRQRMKDFLCGTRSGTGQP